MNMGKKWIRRWMRRVWYVMITAVVLGGSAGCGGQDKEMDMEQWEKKISTAVVSQTYQDAQGHAIVYYCCRTTYYTEEQFVEGKVDRAAIGTVVSLDQTALRDCWVGDWPAILCEQDGRSYLCWTISPEFSCIIEYDAEAVAEEDIFHMAESVVQQR